MIEQTRFNWKNTLSITALVAISVYILQYAWANTIGINPTGLEQLGNIFNLAFSVTPAIFGMLGAVTIFESIVGRDVYDDVEVVYFMGIYTVLATLTYGIILAINPEISYTLSAGNFTVNALVVALVSLASIGSIYTAVNTELL